MGKDDWVGGGRIVIRAWGAAGDGWIKSDGCVGSVYCLWREAVDGAEEMPVVRGGNGASGGGWAGDI